MKIKEVAKVFSGVVGVLAISMIIPTANVKADIEDDVPTIYEGKCGVAANFTYNNQTKVLEITGSGDIDDAVFKNDYVTTPTQYGNITTRGIGKDLETIIIGNGIDDIGTRCFSSCKNLKKVVIADSVTEIEEYAFANCKNLEDVKLPSELKELGELAFENDNLIKTVKIPKTLKHAGHQHGAFSGCELESAVIENGIDKIPDYLFDESGLKTVNFPSSVKVIGKYAFAYCKLTVINLPVKLELIDAYAFAGCRDITEITVYQTAEINAYAFNKIDDPDDWAKMKIHCQKGSRAWKFFEKTLGGNLGNLVATKAPVSKAVTYKSGILKYKVIKIATDGTGTVKVIGMSKNKKRIVIPATVKIEGVVYKVAAIEKNAFKGKRKLKKVTIKSPYITSIGKNAFKKINRKAKIFVPRAKYKTYKKMLKKAGVTKKMKIKKK